MRGRTPAGSGGSVGGGGRVAGAEDIKRWKLTWYFKFPLSRRSDGDERERKKARESDFRGGRKSLVGRLSCRRQVWLSLWTAASARQTPYEDRPLFDALLSARPGRQVGPVR